MNKICGRLGISKKAGKLFCGSEAVIDGIRKNKAKTVYIASDASDNTKKKFCDSCNYYSIKYCILSLTMSQISTAIGKCGNTAVCYISDEELCKAVLNATNEDGGCVYGSTK